MKFMKSVCIKGNLKNGTITYRPLSREFQTDNWYIRLASEGFELISQEKVNEFLTITSNFVTAEKYSEKNEKISYEQPLQLVNLKLSKESNKGDNKTAFRFSDLTPFKVTSANSELKFLFLDESEEPFRKDVKVIIIFQMFTL